MRRDAAEMHRDAAEMHRDAVEMRRDAAEMRRDAAAMDRQAAAGDRQAAAGIGKPRRASASVAGDRQLGWGRCHVPERATRFPTLFAAGGMGRARKSKKQEPAPGGGATPPTK